MEIAVKEVPAEQIAAVLVQYAHIPIAFQVQELLELTMPENLGGFLLSPRRLDVPYVKDYDAVPEEGPASWRHRFDLSNWGLLVAHVEGNLVGGAAVAFKTPNLIMLEDRSDLAVLWDIRVCVNMRNKGVGSALFNMTEEWARARGCRLLKVETQNINVPACRFYLRQGCQLGAIHRFAYPDFPQEIQLLWYKNLKLHLPSLRR